MDYHFRYNGPKSETKVDDCPLCNTAARGKCVLVTDGASPAEDTAHADVPVIGCPHCDAARNRACPSHCGIAKAMKLHAPHDTDPDNSEWRDVRATDRGIIRERVPAAETPERAERIEKARTQFQRTQIFVGVYCKGLPECLVDVHLREDDSEGDDGKRLGSLVLEITARASS